MEDKTPKSKFAKKTDVIAIVVLLLLAGGIWLWYANKPAGPVATVTFADGRAPQSIELAQDATYTFSGDQGLTVTLIVEDQTIRFADSRCPDHLCEGFGRLSQEGDYAICMPAGVSVNLYA